MLGLRVVQGGLHIQVIDPDVFIVNQWYLDTLKGIAVFRAMRARRRRPEQAPAEFADAFEAAELPLTASRLRTALESAFMGALEVHDGRWFVPYHLDVGTGESRFVWQAMLGAGRAFDWGEALVAWRHIDYTTKSGEAIRSLRFSGSMVAASFVR